ncbi:MAG: hypothetical protein GX303_01365 [Clostridiales bacterium]|nr:hypothetical protein [Clostridiales bacterium]
MGFGLLFTGFLLSINFIFPGFTDIFAYLLMFAGITKLSVYNRQFKGAKYLLFSLFAIGLASLALEIIRFLKINNASLESAATYILPITMLFEAVFLYFALSGIRAIAVETGLHHLADRAVRNLFLGAVYYLLNIIMLINHPIINDMYKYFSAPVWLFGLVWMVLNAVLIYSCYIWICLEGDEEMTIKESKYAFVNFFRRIEDKKEQEAHKQGRKLAEKLKHSKKKRSK